MPFNETGAIPKLLPPWLNNWNHLSTTTTRPKTNGRNRLGMLKGTSFMKMLCSLNHGNRDHIMSITHGIMTERPGGTKLDNRPVSLLNQPRSPLRPMRHRRRLRGLVKGLRPRFPRKSGVLRRNLAQSIRLGRLWNKGRTVTQNLIITKDPSVVDEIQQLWNAFEQTQPLTVATVVSNDQTGPTVSVWWDLSKQLTHKPARVKLKLWQASSTNGPIPQKPQILNDFVVSDRPKQVTVRILAPEFYRKLLPGIDHADTPATAITEWSQLLGCRVSSIERGQLAKCVPQTWMYLGWSS